MLGVETEAEAACYVSIGRTHGQQNCSHSPANDNNQTNYLLLFHTKDYTCLEDPHRKTSHIKIHEKMMKIVGHWSPPWSATLPWWWGLCIDDPDDF